MAARLAMGETRPPGESPGLGTSMEPAALAWRPNPIDDRAAGRRHGQDALVRKLPPRRIALGSCSTELTIDRSGLRIINEHKGNAMKIIIVVEDGDDIELAQQIAEDIPHQTFSATGIPIEVRTDQRNG